MSRLQNHPSFSIFHIRIMWRGMVCLLGLALYSARGAEEEATRPGIQTVRSIDRNTTLAGGGRAPAILAPAGTEYATVAGTLEASLEKRLGVKPERATTLESAQPGKRTIIAVGNMLTNPLITRLYFNGYAFEDALCPAGDAFVVRVVYNPYPWRGNQNVIILGCATAEGGVRAAKAFMQRIEGDGLKTFLPYTLVVSEDATPYTPYAERGSNMRLPLEALPGSGVGQARPVYHYVLCVDAYLRSGRKEAAQRAVDSIAEIVRWYHEAGDKADLATAAWPMGWEIFFAWEPFEYHPLLPDSLRHEFVNYLLVGMKHMHDHQMGYPRGKDIGPIWNHLTEPLCGAYAAGRYFHDYYGIADGKKQMDEARDAFIWQAKSWRSAEDAGGSYLGMATKTCAIWSLAEWQLDYFQSGNALKNAEYYMTICDQTGEVAGFGDGGRSGRDTLNENLPIVFWYTRDPRILWCLNSWNNGAWSNPYWHDVPPAAPNDVLGVKAVAFDEQLYQRTLKLPYYAEAPPTTTVNMKEAFDKLTFKDTWEQSGQFLCLDGFGRGYHLHYDTQAIIRLSSDNEMWLFDDDYLERESQRHSMVTLLYNGRCAEVVPTFARLDEISDSAEWGTSVTTVPKYNHADWTRAIVWRKGKYFFLFDELKALDPGEFVFDAGFRMWSWPHDRQRMLGAREFLAERNLPKQSRKIAVVDDAAASGGKAVELTQPEDVLNFGLDLPAGAVTVAVDGQSKDKNRPCSVFLPIGGEQKVVTLGQGTYTNGTAGFNIDKAGRQSVTIWPREGTPLRIDRILVRGQDGTERVYEAETLPPPPIGELTKRFVMQSADRVGMIAYNEWVNRLTRNRMYVRQRRTAGLTAGEMRSFATLMVPTARERRGTYKVKRIGPRAFVISGSEPAFVAFGRFTNGPVDVDAACLMISPCAIEAVKTKRLRIGDYAGDRSPEAIRMATKTALDYVAGLPEQPEDEPGGNEFLPEGIPIAGKPTAPAWRARFPEGNGRINQLRVADLDGDGASEVLVIRDNILYCFDQDGRERWRYAVKRTLNDFVVGKFRVGKERQVAFGGDDCEIYLVDARGTELKRTAYKGHRFERGNPGPEPVLCLAAADFSGDGADEIAAGGKDWHVHLYDADMNERLKTIPVDHNAHEIHCADSNGDGRPELFVADNYGTARGYQISPSLSDAKVIFSAYLAIGETVCAVGDLDGQPGAEVVMGVTTGELGAIKMPPATTYYWRFDNFGYDVNKLRIEDMNGDGAGDVIVCGATGYLFVLDGKSEKEGRVLMRHRVGRWVKDALVVRDRNGCLAVLAGDANGRLVVAGMDGNEQFAAQSPSGIVRIAALSDGDKDRYIVATANGELLAFDWRKKAGTYDNCLKRLLRKIRLFFH